MIELIIDDEYGVPFAIDTFLTVDDARDALNQMECSLEDCVTAARAYRLTQAIDQLKQSIADHENGDD
jgi:hypothetical protein